MKKVIIVIISGIIIFVSVSLLMNKCMNNMRQSIENETKQEIKIEETINKYDLDLTIGEYNLNSYLERLNFVNYINNKYTDEKYRKFTNVEEVAEDIDDLLVKQYDNKNYVIRRLLSIAKRNVFQLLLSPNGDWADLPITENIRKKFNEKDGVLGYYKLPNDLVEKGILGYEGNNIYKVIVEKNDKKNNYVFYYTFDENGYYDTIYYLGELSYNPILEGNYNNRMSLYNEERIKECILEICASEKYLLASDDEYLNMREHYSNMCVTCMDNDFRNRVFKNDGILPIKDYEKDSLEIVEYDNNKKEAIVKIAINDKKIYYKITLELYEDKFVETVSEDSVYTTDGYYLKNAKVELEKEEEK